MILVVDMNSESLAFHEFVLPIVSVVRKFADYEIKHYDEIRAEDLGKYERIILSGVPLKDNRFVEEREKFEWLRVCELPVLGICAGMQIIAITFGSSLVRCQEIGMIRVRTVRENPLFSGEFQAYGLHKYAVNPSKEFEVLAVSSKCVQAVKHKKKGIYGVLFHPEVRNREIIERFCSL